jgi:hypothetical protein
MLGERDRARLVAQRHSASLRATPSGVGLLELLALAPYSSRLPGGHIHYVQLSRRIADGTLGAGELASIFQEVKVFTKEPELLLLFYNALRPHEPEAALRFMNRYLRAHGLWPALELPGAIGEREGLPAFRFASTKRHQDGPLVSVLVAVHDAAMTVEGSVASLLDQSYLPLEILIGDDASEDDTLSVLERRFGTEPRVRLFRSSRNQGAYNVRNALAARARGELITYHDGDDIALPQRIALQVATLQKPGTIGCVSNYLRFDASGAVTFSKQQAASRLCSVSLMLTRRALDEVGPFRCARVGADAERYARLLGRYGGQALRRLRLPLLFCSWLAGSATRGAGFESSLDGYRSPARRAYAEDIYAMQCRRSGVSDLTIDARLRTFDNYEEPSSLVEV